MTVKNIVRRTKTKYLDYELRHQRILDAAFRLFNAKGYKMTTTAELAAEAGISEPVLYQHFESKKHLFIECFQSIKKELVSGYKKIEARHPDDEINYIKGVIEVYLDFVIKNPHKSMFLIHMFSYTDEPEFHILFKKFMDTCITRIEREIDKAKQKGTIKNPLNSRFLAGLLVVQHFTAVLPKNYIDPALFDKQNLLEVFMKMLVG